MATFQTYYVGTEDEVAHHAQPLRQHLPVRIADCSRVMRLVRPGDVAIFFSEHFDRFRDTCSALKSAHCATIYAIDGILEWRNAWENDPGEPACPWTMRPVLSDKVACIGPSQARTLDTWGNRGKTEIVGIPRFDTLRNLGSPPGESDIFRVLIMTAKCPAFTSAQAQRVQQSLSDLKLWFHRNPTVDGRRVELVWRLTRGLERGIEVDNQLNDITGGELREILATVDAVITTPSTAMLEAMLMNRPVAILDYTNSPAYVQAAWRITAEQHLDTVIGQLASPPEPKLLFQNAVLSDALAFVGNAGKRMAQLVESMQRWAHDCRAEGRTVVFPQQMLPELADAKPQAGFDHARLYARYREFQCQNPTELQAELAHARREITHLNKQIKQLEGELAQAHKVFKQIHRHPIAGPIVRLRQRILGAISNSHRKS